MTTCPGCHEPAGFWRYAYPPRLVKRGKYPAWATAAAHEVEHGHWRGGCCIHLAARETGAPK